MTYLSLSAFFVGLALVVLLIAVLRRSPDRVWWTATGITAVVLLVLTAVFDNLMIGLDLFRYSDDQISGLHIGLAPIEDFAWPVAVVAALPSLWLLLGGSRR
ncbi:lycopene cyclase domain-containing protein [Nocardioides pacificus]